MRRNEISRERSFTYVYGQWGDCEQTNRINESGIGLDGVRETFEYTWTTYFLDSHYDQEKI